MNFELVYNSLINFILKSEYIIVFIINKIYSNLLFIKISRYFIALNYKNISGIIFSLFK